MVVFYFKFYTFVLALPLWNMENKTETKNILAKWDLSKDPSRVDYNYNAEIYEGEIRIFGYDNNKKFDRTFKVGDTVEYGS